MTMENQSGKAEKLFSELGRKIDQILENTKDDRQEIKADIKEKIEELKKAKAKLENEFQEFTSNKDGKWTDVKNHMENAVNEIKSALDSVFRKTREDQP
jgi:hypothetical protein